MRRIALLLGLLFSASSAFAQAPATGLPPYGSFVRRGVFFGADADGDDQFFSEVYELDGRGALFVEGTHPGKVLGVEGVRRAWIGGVGEFARAQGELMR